MDWLRWWHGSSTDPKFRMIAAECNMPLASILGLWAYIIESASSNKIRGQIDHFDMEVAGFHLGIDVVTPCNAMKRRNMFHETDETLHVTNWEKWQPKREREEVSTDRVRKYRDKQKQTLSNDETHVTPCNASETHVTPRVDKRREDIEPSDFDIFWKAHPKKVGKAETRKAWDAMKINGEFPQIMEALERQKLSKKWQDGFILDPVRWVKGRRWEDDLASQTVIEETKEERHARLMRAAT